MDEILTVHGSQAYANFSEIKADGISKFQQRLVDRKINHILGIVHHPQTNGMHSKTISPASIEQLLL
jgi:glycosylphosphatidylinositol transamidase (GPIT) subunit GPI8